MKFIRAALLLGLLTLIGCSDSKVVLQARSGGKKLVYDCNNFRPQVETPEDISILVSAAAETASDAVKSGSMITFEEIDGAMSRDDWRALERTVVMYRGSHKKK